MTTDQQQNLVELLSTDLERGRPEAAAAASSLAGTRGSRDILDRLLERTLGSLEAVAHIMPEHLAMLDFATAHSDRVDSSRLDGLLTRMEVWISEQPDQRVQLASHIPRLANLKPAQRERLSRFLIGTEKSDEERLDVRVALLRAASRIRGHGNSRAARAVDSRLEELRRAGGESAEIADAVSND